MLLALIATATAFASSTPAGDLALTGASVHVREGTAPGTPPGDLALTRASVHVREGTLEWSVRTAGAWEAGELDGQRRICLTLWAGDRALPRARLCLTGISGRLAAGPAAANVTRSDERSARADIPLKALGLNERVLFWQASSRSCEAGCETRVPDLGKRTLDLRPRPRTLPALLAPRPHADARDAADPRLDIRDVAFGQRDVRVVLSARTQRPAGGAASLCVLVSRTRALTSPARLCIVGRALTFQADPSATPRRVAATVQGRRTVQATVLASALGLGRGRLWWAAQSRRAGCAAGCEDRVPDRGAFPAMLSAFGAPRCFGAAARAAKHPCRNPSLLDAAYPTPANAAVWPASPCTPLARPGAAFNPCGFGVADARSRATIALVGDSHAAHWRAALEVVAQANGWHGISITRPGCPFSTRIPSSPALGPAACLEQHAETIAWLRANPGVHTVFISDWAEPAGGPQGGTGGYGGGQAAYRAMLDRLPASVRRVYVLRDVPATTPRASACVEGLLRRRRAIGSACASPRSAVVTADPGAAAARRAPRARVLDLTRFFCGASRCFPVVGGVFVHKDDNHMNAVFAATLGPFLLRALRRAPAR